MNAPVVTSPTVTTSTDASRARVAASEATMITAPRISRRTANALSPPAPRSLISTRLTLMAVLRSQLLGEGNRLEERGNSLNRTVRHIRNGLAAPTHRFDVDALRYEILNELIVTTRRRVMQRVVAVQVAQVRIELELFDQILDRR